MKKSFTATIEVPKTPQEVFTAITDVTNWWSKDFVGNSKDLDDEFVVNHPGQHYSKQKLVEVIPYKKIIWLVTESKLNWLKHNQQEWTNTKMIFEIATKGDKTILHFTHEGLVPESECFAMCAQGWEIIIKDWLFHFIASGKPSAKMAQAADIRNQAVKDHASFKSSITAKVTAKDAFQAICKPNDWWGHIEGKTERANDVFTYRPNDTWVNFKITECNDKKVVWHVTDCYLHFQSNKTEWTNTDVVFEIVENGNTTEINFTHVGLVPEVECYENCVKGWKRYFKDSLLKLLTTGKGQV